MTVGELIEVLEQYPAAHKVEIEGYATETEKDNRGYEIVDVDAAKSEDGKVTVYLWGLLKVPFTGN